MRVEVIGEGEPEYAVVACVHGDETSGWEAVQKLKESDLEFLKPLKIILANERAFEKGERFLDVDLNRVFPGDPESDLYEERLAAELVKELEGLKFIDLHSTASREAPFVIVEHTSRTQLELIKSTGLETAVDMTHVGAKNPELEFVGVEVSERSEDPARDAYRVLLNFLAAEGVIEASHSRSEPDLFKVYATEMGEGFEFLASNFEEVSAGEVFAKKPGSEKTAEEDFYPVLMSTDGYEDMIGFKALKVEENEILED